MHLPETDATDANDNTKIDPATQESIKQGQEVIKIQQDQNPASKEKKESDASKDAEKWRNEG